MTGKERDEGAHRPLVCPTCARPFEDEVGRESSVERSFPPDHYETDGRGLTWIKLGGMVRE